MSALQPDRMQRGWTRAETVLAFELYLLLPERQRNNALSPQIQALAAATGRSAGSVKARLQNFKSLDPDYIASGRVGLTGFSATDAAIAGEYWGH